MASVCAGRKLGAIYLRVFLCDLGCCLYCLRFAVLYQPVYLLHRNGSRVSDGLRPLDNPLMQPISTLFAVLAVLLILVLHIQSEAKVSDLVVRHTYMVLHGFGK